MLEYASAKYIEGRQLVYLRFSLFDALFRENCNALLSGIEGKEDEWWCISTCAKGVGSAYAKAHHLRYNWYTGMKYAASVTLLSTTRGCRIGGRQLSYRSNIHAQALTFVVVACVANISR